VLLGSCSKQGCTDPIATNYNSSAEQDDGSCEYATDLVNASLDPRIVGVWKSSFNLSDTSGPSSNWGQNCKSSLGYISGDIILNIFSSGNIVVEIEIDESLDFDEYNNLSGVSYPDGSIDLNTQATVNNSTSFETLDNQRIYTQDGVFDYTVSQTELSFTTSHINLWFDYYQSLYYNPLSNCNVGFNYVISIMPNTFIKQ
jgi:hypothetical protein